MNNGYYQNTLFPGQGLNNNTIPNQQSVPSYEQSQISSDCLTVNKEIPVASSKNKSKSRILNLFKKNIKKKLKFILINLKD